MNRQPARPIAKAPQVAPEGAPQVASAPMVKFPEPLFTGLPSLSVIPHGVEGVVIITGPRGMGKTTFGLGIDDPNLICMLDNESKGSTLALPLGVGAYFPVLDEVISLYGEDFNAQAIFDRTIQIIKAIPQDRFSTLFIDNAAYLQDGAAQLIRNNPAKAVRYGLKPENILSGGYGGPWPAVGHLINNLFKLAHSRGIKLVVASFQLKGAWKDGRPLFNKVKITDVAVWHEQSILTVALQEPLPQYAPCPRGLVIKESLGLMKWDPELRRSTMVRRLPYALPRAEMWEIYNYLDHPADFANPKPGETVDAMELAQFSSNWSKDQIVWLERAARAQSQLVGDQDEPNGHSPKGDT